MLVIGAGGLAKEILEILSVEMNLPDEKIIFFDDINKEEDLLFSRFKILHDFHEVKAYFQLKKNPRYTLGLGTPSKRRDFSEKIGKVGGQLTSLISKNAKIGSFNTNIGKGTVIMPGVIITNNIQIGKGVLINLNSSVSHDTIVSDYVEIACGVNIAGRCKIEKNVFIGTNATILPNLTIGENSIIGAGAVVISDVPRNVTVVGNPAKIIKNDG